MSIKKNINKNKKKSVKKFVLLCVAIMLSALISLFIVTFNYLFGGLNHKKITKDFDELGINSSRYEETVDSKIVNIALFGVDSRTESFSGLSDSIMIASFDKKSGYIKLSSIARDSQVDIKDVGVTKINAAYSNGGPVLAINTINRNFNMDIQDYVTINISNLAKVIDAAGGVTIDITQAEQNAANIIMNELTPNAPKISKSGTVHLDGTQATAFCRIRKLDSDLYRIDRQKKVLQSLFDKAVKLSPTKMAETIHTMMPMVETSLDYDKIFSLSSLATNKNLELVNMKFPNSESNYTSSPTTNWQIIYDLDVAKQQLYDFVYNDVRID